jgi:YidC/Oxa1 family membrane protein insertase
MTAFLGGILGKLLKFVYDMVSTIGAEPENLSFYAIAIIITTIIFKLLLLPINLQQAKSTKKMGELQPQMKEIQTKYKNDPQTQQVKMQELYKKHNYNPASGCLILLIQMPIIFAFFAVFRDPARYAFTEPGFYEAMNKTFFWIKNLDNPDPYLWGLPLLAALTTYIQSAVMAPPNSDPQAQATQKTMSYFLPVMIFMASKGFAAGLALYWVISNIFTIVQQLISNRSLGKIKEDK